MNPYDQAKHEARVAADMERIGELVRDETQSRMDVAVQVYTMGAETEGGALKDEQATFLDSTAQQVMPYALEVCCRAALATGNSGEDGTQPARDAATLAYDAAHALLQERERRRK